VAVAKVAEEVCSVELETPSIILSHIAITRWASVQYMSFTHSGSISTALSSLSEATYFWALSYPTTAS
jgi:hypothetical protein